MLYDHISFHLNEDFPMGVPESQAANHMGFYFVWAVSQNLHHADWEKHPRFADLRAGRLSGSAFVRECMDGGIGDSDFNDHGRRFTEFYYQDEEDGYGRFMDDYFLALGLEMVDDFYRVEDTPDNQHRLSETFQAAYRRWSQSLRGEATKW